MKSTKRPKFKFFLYDNEKRSFIEISDGTVCGRMDGNVRFPSDDLVSRRHCQFSVVGNDVYIEDLHSTNQTKVNGVPLRAHKKRRLHLNDVIEFGSQRFILTNQDKVQPPNTDDNPKRKAVYKGLRTDDGYLTSHVSRVFTKKTLIMLDKYSFHKLRLKEMLLRRKPVKRVEVVGESRPVANHATTGPDLSSLFLAVNLLVGWGLIVLALHSQGAFDENLVHPAETLLAGLAAIALGGTLIAVLVHVLALRRFARGFASHFAIFLLWLTSVFCASVYVGIQTDVVGNVRDNLAIFHCIKHYSAESCKRYGPRDGTRHRILRSLGP